MDEPRIVIVGAGPAGVRAAEVLVAAGLRPVVVDENQRAGGQVYRQPPAGFVRSKKQLYGFESAKADALHRTFNKLRSYINYLPETLVWNCDGRQLDLLGRGQHQSLPYSHLVLCTGAIDRVLPFPGWLLPGVYTLGAAQVALKAQGCVIGSRIVLAGSGPLLYLLAYQYAKAGADIAAVLDTASFAGKLQATFDLLKQPLALAKGLYFLAWLHCHGVKVVEGVEKIAVKGEQKVETISWHKDGREQTLECDAVASGFGLRSETQLADLAGCAFEFSPGAAASRGYTLRAMAAALPAPTPPNWRDGAPPWLCLKTWERQSTWEKAGALIVHCNAYRGFGADWSAHFQRRSNGRASAPMKKSFAAVKKSRRANCAMP
jgi:NADPH-dependent 2,4-dienoyl-CoA reductase/sulfur reductase-like enzyme